MSQNNYLKSTIGRKQIVGITGLSLCLFLFMHVTGNFLLFVSPKAYNTYSHMLVSNPLLVVAELGLVALLLGHIANALRLSLINSRARPEKYAMSAKGDKSTPLVTKFMWQQGVIILVFIVLHLITFKYGKVIYAEYDGTKMRDLFQLVVEVFQSPVYLAWYGVALVVLGLHLSHGFQSTLKTLGFNHPKYEPKIKILGSLFSFYISVGFMIQPIYIYFFYKG